MGNEKPDIIIIGSGIIGAAIAFEASKRGFKTLTLDKLAVAGYGSTSNTCAIIRTHYSTWEGTAIAYESFFYWEELAGISRSRRRNMLSRAQAHRLAHHSDQGSGSV